ncbi:hypothetical protein M8C21_004441 [Ambrosia artemisiifolia]|uniref:Phosphatidic acid phosphatase type 2/haloperoxidase domain-containing protein n=1 Tax=Ambrosia artemisiifolia TaxID=4212 RepID=A0AAD5CD44_AMBAR|nr:hypothetical protein M8C21_004441 [Ambrosia artemisiifolia]
MASLVAVSRVDDYWHHWQDVFAGGLLGLTVATFCYLQFFPAPYHTEGWGPYAYFRALEEARSNRRVDQSAPEVSLGIPDLNQQSRQDRSGPGLALDSSPDYHSYSLESDVESGKV